MDEAHIAERLAVEHEKVAIISRDLRATLDERPPGNDPQWLEMLRKGCFAFRAHMTHRIALTEVGGLYNDLLEVRPGITNEIRGLRTQQRDVLARTESIHRLLQDVSASTDHRLDSVTLELGKLLREVDKLTEEENNLVCLVHMQDIGGEDG